MENSCLKTSVIIDDKPQMEMNENYPPLKSPPLCHDGSPQGGGGGGTHDVTGGLHHKTIPL